MISPKKIYLKLKKNKISYFIGVPDSVLKNFLNLIPKKQNLVSTNEGSAVAQGIGYYLATKKIPVIYMQNSGLGNALNPLISIANHKVYSIPLFLVIGWRGSPDSKDEPQHLAKGHITRDILKLMGIKNFIINNNKDLKKIDTLKKYAIKKKRTVAILIKNKKIENKNYSIDREKKSKFLRADFIKYFLNFVKADTKIISTTGYTSRELNEIRKNENKLSGEDFYMVGGMGHAAALGSIYAKFKKKKEVYILDGDGSMLMHLGALAVSTKNIKKKIKYILFNNECHESVGKQKTYISNINLSLMAKSFGFQKYYEIKNKKNMKKIIKNILISKKNVFINVKIDPGSIRNLSRPNNLKTIKNNFLK